MIKIIFKVSAWWFYLMVGDHAFGVLLDTPEFRQNLLQILIRTCHLLIFLPHVFIFSFELLHLGFLTQFQLFFESLIFEVNSFHFWFYDLLISFHLRLYSFILTYFGLHIFHDRKLFLVILHLHIWGFQTRSKLLYFIVLDFFDLLFGYHHHNIFLLFILIPQIIQLFPQHCVFRLLKL